MFEQQSRPLIFGHRGASAHAPENTLAAFNLAASVGADGIELDAKLSADGVVMVMHDATVDRTTKGAGRVNQLTLAELKELDAGSPFDPRFTGEKIPTLAEVFEQIGQRLYINVELTNYHSRNDRLPELTADLVRKFNLMQRVVISSFYPQNLARFRQALPGVPVCLLALVGTAGLLARNILTNWYHCDGLNPYFSDVTSRMVEQQHKHKRLVNVWTVNQPEEMRRLVTLHVDGIITDDPGTACQIAREML